MPGAVPTGVALAALGRTRDAAGTERIEASTGRAGRWLEEALGAGERLAAPIGLYFARLWYYEDVYPLVFALAGLQTARSLRVR